MKKISALVLILLLQCTFPHGLQADSTVRVGIYNNEPLISIGSDGKGRGFFADILEYTASREGWRLEYVPGTWKQCLSRLENNRIDILCTMAFSKDRDKLYDFNRESILINWGVLYTAKDSEIDDVTDVAGKRVAVLKGDIYTAMFREIINAFEVKGCELIETDGYHAVMDMVSRHEVDAGVTGRFFGMVNQNRYKVEKSGILLHPMKIHYAVPQGKNRELLTGIDTHIKLLKNDKASIYSRSFEKWFGNVSGKSEFPFWGQWALCSILGVAAILFFGNLVLRNRIKAKTEALTLELARRSEIEKKLKENKKELQRSRERFRKLSNLSFEGLLIHDNGVAVDVNEPLIKMLGCAREDILGRNVIELFVTEEYHAILQENIARRPTNPYEIMVRKKNGTLFPVELESKNIKIGDESFRVTAVRDITQRRRMEAALLEEQAFVENILDTARVIILVLDREGRIVRFNRYTEELSGYRLDEVRGRDWFSTFLPAENLLRTKALFQKAVEGAGIHNHGNVSALMKKDGSQYMIEWYYNSLKTPGGDVMGILSIGLNITEKMKLEAHLHQARKMEAIGTLAGGIAHDFNNILFPIVGHVEMLLEDISEESPFREGLLGIYHGALRARDLTKQILTFSRQEKGDLKLIKIEPVIREVLKLMRSTIPATIEIKERIEEGCGIIKADPVQIHQIVMNLAVNAYHAMEEKGGDMTVGLAKVQPGEFDLPDPDMKKGRYVCLTLADTGMGMDKEVMGKIFDPFFTTKEKDKGTGMGLSVVHGIVHGLGGGIKVYSEPGRGTEFRVYLPLLKAASEDHSVPSAQLIPGRGENVLLVDDEDVIVTIEKKMLERLGYQVVSRTSSLEALEAFRGASDKFDVVITDMTMPNMSGEVLARELVKIRSDIPILLCTGFSEIMSQKEAAYMGIQGILPKPVVMKALSQKIREVLDRQQAAS